LWLEIWKDGSRIGDERARKDENHHDCKSFSDHRKSATTETMLIITFDWDDCFLSCRVHPTCGNSKVLSVTTVINACRQSVEALPGGASDYNKFVLDRKLKFFITS
jgi:hypothetical protein